MVEVCEKGRMRNEGEKLWLHSCLNQNHLSSDVAIFLQY